MQYNFDEVYDRRNTHSLKWNEINKYEDNEDLIPLWVADMDFKSPLEVINALRSRVDHGIFGYMVNPESYYEAITNWLKKRFDLLIEKDWIIDTPGVVSALKAAIISFTSPGEKILIQTPVYHPFLHSIANNNREIVNNQLKFDGEKYTMDFEDLRKKLQSGVKMSILCSPHNPVGRVWSVDELRKYYLLCREYNVLIVSDEIHSDIIYRNFTHFPTMSILPEALENTITLIAPSKTFNLAGLSTSCVIIPNTNLRKTYNSTLNNYGLRNNNIFGSIALEAAYTYGEEWLTQLLDYLESNLNFLISFIENNIPEIKVIKPEGTYLVWLDFRGLKLHGSKLRKFLTSEARVLLNDGSMFGEGGEGFQRINIGCPRATLKEGLERIMNAVKSFEDL